LNETAKPLVDV